MTDSRFDLKYLNLSSDYFSLTARVAVENIHVRSLASGKSESSLLDGWLPDYTSIIIMALLTIPIAFCALVKLIRISCREKRF